MKYYGFLSKNMRSIKAVLVVVFSLFAPYGFLRPDAVFAASEKDNSLFTSSSPREEKVGGGKTNINHPPEKNLNQNKNEAKNTIPALASPASSWFRYFSNVTEEWEIVGAASNPFLFHARLKKLKEQTEKYKILVLYSRSSPAYDTSISTILDVFERKQINAHFTILNFKLDDSMGLAELQQAEKEGVNLIFSMGSETTAWLWEKYKNRSIPIVSVCSKDPVQLGQIQNYETGSNTNFAFTSLNIPIETQMALVREIKPKLRNIAILVDSKNYSAIETQSKPMLEYAQTKGINAFELAVEDPLNARNELAGLVEKATKDMQRSDPELRHSIYWLTGSTSVFKEIETINLYAGKIPVLSVVSEPVREGINSAAISIGVSFESNAYLASIYAADILEGRMKAGEMRVGVTSPPDIALNFRKIRDANMTIPFSMFEAAGIIYNYDGEAVRMESAASKKMNNKDQPRL